MSNQDELQSAVLAFEQWRNTRTHGAAKIPEALRQQSIQLLPHYKVSHIIRALKLSHSQLKRWEHKGLKKVPAQTRFIQLPEENTVPANVNDALNTGSLTVELQFPQGTQLRLSGNLSETMLSTLVQTLSHVQAAQNGGDV
jgi:hypothetical protein